MNELNSIGLEEEYLAELMTYEEHKKIPINISFFADEIIRNDIMFFSQNSEVINNSKFFFQIINNYYVESIASINLQAKNDYQAIRKYLDKTKIIEYKSNITKEKENILLEKFSSILNRKQGKIYRLSGKSVRHILYPNFDVIEEVINANKPGNYKSIATYFSAILEDYAILPLVKREEFFYKHILNNIDYAFSRKYALKVVIEDSFSNNNRVFVFKYPYYVLQDKSNSYNYVVGFNKEYNSEQDYCIKAIRLYKIKEVKFVKTFRQLSKDEETKLNDELKNRPVEFISGEDIDIKIEFTKKGLKYLSEQLFLKPSIFIQDENNPNVFTTKCTKYQIINYLFKFGKEAKIIEPNYLRKEMEKRYYKAYISYKDESL